MDASSNKKRRTLDDFFVATAPAKRLKPPPSQAFALSSVARVPGLCVITDFVTNKEEAALLEFLDRQQWRTDLSRRCIHYNGEYCLMPPRSATPEERKKIERNILTAPPMPEELDYITTRMIGSGLYTTESRPEFCIVNEYRNSQGISSHVDNLAYKGPVCALTLSQGDFMRFHELVEADDGSVRSGKASLAKRTGRKEDVWMPRRSLLVMAGEAREKWQHEIVRSRRGRHGDAWRRVSLTFRSSKSKTRSRHRSWVEEQAAS